MAASAKKKYDKDKGTLQLAEDCAARDPTTGLHQMPLAAEHIDTGQKSDRWRNLYGQHVPKNYGRQNFVSTKEMLSRQTEDS